MHAILILSCLTCAAYPATDPPPREKLDRGLTAQTLPDGQVYLSWRLLQNEPAELGFNVYVTGGAPARGAEVQRRADPRHDRFPGPRRLRMPDKPRWSVRPVLDGVEGPASARSRAHAPSPMSRSSSTATTPSRRSASPTWTATALRFRAQAAQQQHRPVREILEAQPRHLQAGSLPQRRQVPVAARPGLGDRAGHLVLALRGLRPRRRRPGRGGGEDRRGRPARQGRPRAERAGIPDDPRRADRPAA